MSENQDQYQLLEAMLAENRLPPAGGADLDPVCRTPEYPASDRLIRDLSAEGLRSYMSVPLRVQDELIGSLNLWRDRPGAFTPEEISIVREMANSLAIAIKHARLFEQVRAGREQLAVLSRRLLEAQESERRHLARELHDEIGQALTAVKINLQTIQHLPGLETCTAYLQDSIGIVDSALQQVRGLCLDLRPAILDDLGLGAALRWYVDRQAWQAGLTAQVIADLPEERLPPELETTCFRVVQEAITNVLRHARAQRVEVEVRQHESTLQLLIRDDGVGFEVRAACQRAARGESMGLLSMEERVRLTGGKMHIQSAAGQGTEIEVGFPLAGQPGPVERRTQGRGSPSP